MPDILSPIDGRVAFTFENLSTGGALKKLGAAEETQRAWAGTPMTERIALCERMLERFADRLPTNAEQITRMMGKPIVQARAEFSGGTCERTRYLCSIAEPALADFEVTDRPGFRRTIRRVPVGVVLDVAAWNYPLLIAINVIVPAVLAGNAVLIKHASQTALVAEQFERAFAEAGAPPGLVQAFPVDHETAAHVIATRRIGYVSFTGSVRGGHEVYRSVAERSFIGVGLELGGKDPALVLPDAPVQQTAENLVDGAFYNAGQSCCAVERIYVHQAIYDRFIEAFVDAARRYVLGNPLDESTTMGPLVRPGAARHVYEQVQHAIAGGARLLVGPADFHVPDTSLCYVAPHVLDRVDHKMALMREETFGPAIGIMKVPSIDEGVRLMNDSPYGLTASIWTSDADCGAAITADVEAGTVYVNRCDYLDPALAWTGIKDSGMGCSLSAFGFLPVTRPKSFHIREQL